MEAAVWRSSCGTSRGTAALSSRPSARHTCRARPETHAGFHTRRRKLFERSTSPREDVNTRSSPLRPARCSTRWVSQELGHDDRARFMRLRGAEHSPTVDLGYGLRDGQTSAPGVDPLDAQRRGLAEPESAVAEHQREKLVVVAGAREVGKLRVREVLPLRLREARKVNACRRIRRYPAVAYGSVEHREST